ncbi:hypothetical protein PFMC_02248 [Plasmodium falciparum CAMP/Malaysia]|uniref:Plasmodium RESA N-terminal domain-containing protein n=1 Tax=Plasmodium falciparum (isolate Camp / Malaysia) TaxID=5835 RepID=A0A024X9C0_PLAFC|nr:hypothetical protein PFMC_02248 [Plasmodium falciparum CAMP/Malaysia]
MKEFIILYRRLFTYKYKFYHHFYHSDRPICVNNKHLKDGKSIDEMKNCIYAFIKYYNTLQNDLFNEHKTIFTDRMKNTQKLDM